MLSHRSLAANRQLSALTAVIMSSSLIMGCQKLSSRKILSSVEGNSTGQVTAPQTKSCGTSGTSVGFQRLTRTEYANIVSTLTGLGRDQIDIQRLPADTLASSAYNMKNFSASQSIDGGYYEEYFHLAESLVDLAFSDHTFAPSCDVETMTFDSCGKKVVSDFASRAFRQAAVPSAVDSVLKVAQSGDTNLDKVKMGMVATLVSPYFLYKNYQAKNQGSRALTAIDLAHRLASVLWSDLPDVQLLASAQAGKLSSSTGLRTEIKRMLESPKVHNGYIKDYLFQWFELYKLETTALNPMRFPEWNENLRRDYSTESAVFFEFILRQERPLIEIIDANYSFAKSNSGIWSQKIYTDGRGGLLTQGGFLASHSTSAESSIQKRGYFYLKRVMCNPPLTPPKVLELPEGLVPENPSPLDYAKARQQAPACLGCHRMIDPLGIPLENFNPLGNFISQYENGAAIDPTSALGGAGFNGVASLKEFADQKAESFYQCLAKSTLAYSVGRELDDVDLCNSQNIGTIISSKKGSIVDLIEQIVATPAFLRE
ncbi:MAG: DUF1592 domain-containing protein [Bdellovibrionales bacterium]